MITRVMTTGGSGGLGNKVLSRLLERGYSVSDISLDYEFLETSIKTHQNFNGNEYDLKLLTKTDDLNIDVSEISHLVLMHGALKTSNFLKLEFDDLLYHLQTNFISSFILAQKIISSWVASGIKSNDRSITFISSVSVNCASPDELAYHCSKSAMESAMHTFARDLSKYNIRSNIVSPGLMPTSLGNRVINQRPDVMDRIPLKRTVDIEDVANVVISCIENKSITGETIHINCGRFMDF